MDHKNHTHTALGSQSTALLFKGLIFLKEQERSYSPPPPPQKKKKKERQTQNIITQNNTVHTGFHCLAVLLASGLLLSRSKHEIFNVCTEFLTCSQIFMCCVHEGETLQRALCTSADSAELRSLTSPCARETRTHTSGLQSTTSTSYSLLSTTSA